MTIEISKFLSDDAILEALGNRIARRRLSRQITQAALAEEAGLSKRTVERIEAGGTSQLLSLIRVLRVLDLLSGLDLLVPDTGPPLQTRPENPGRGVSRSKDVAGLWPGRMIPHEHSR